MYNAPLDDMQFLIDDVCRAGERLGNLPRFEGLDVGGDLTTALLEEAGKLAADMVSPLRRVGDQQPARCSDRPRASQRAWSHASREGGS